MGAGSISSLAHKYLNLMIENLLKFAGSISGLALVVMQIFKWSKINELK